jgi:hypothetical protein
MSATTLSPPASPTDGVREQLLAAIEAERAAIREWRKTECNTPPGFAYWRAVRNLIDVWANCEKIPGEVLHLTPFVFRLASQVQNHLLRWASTYDQRMPETLSGMGGVASMGDALGEQVKQLGVAKVELESVAELLEQNVPLDQIARIWGTDVDSIKSEKANPGSVKFALPLPNGAERWHYTATIKDLSRLARVVEALFESPDDREAAQKLDPESRVFRDIHNISSRPV